MSIKKHTCEAVQGPLGALVAGTGKLVHGFWEHPCHDCTVKANNDIGIAPDESEAWNHAADIAERVVTETTEEE